MAGKKTRPVIGKLLTTSHRSGVTEAGSSPRTPLDLKILSPRGVVNCDVGVVGLGIVAALEKSGDDIRCRKPIPRVMEAPKVDVYDEDEEEYTIVTRHMPNNSYTRVYDGGFVYEGYVTKREASLFDISPATLDIKGYQAPDFLSCCHLCNKKLHGKDIYMYRGEKAFCSIDCRCMEMGMEERLDKQRCGSVSEAVSSRHGQMMSTGIFAI